MTAEEAIRDMRMEADACADCADPDDPFTKAIGVGLAKWADAIEAELKATKFSAEEREALRAFIYFGENMDASPIYTRAAAKLRKMLEEAP